MPLPSSQFQQIFAGDDTNTLIDVSAFVKTARVPNSNTELNNTAFSAGGGSVTQSRGQGAIQSAPVVEFYFDPAILNILQRIMGARGGSTWQFLNGNNASPVGGDQMYQGTFTLFGIMIDNYKAGQDATFTTDLGPTDGGAIVPDWYTA